MRQNADMYAEAAWLQTVDPDIRRYITGDAATSTCTTRSRSIRA